MFERFSDNARQTIVKAQEIARKLNDRQIGTLEILLALVAQSETNAGIALARAGITDEKIRAHFVNEIAIFASNEPPSGHIPFSHDAKYALERTLREAMRFGQNFIATEHILLALISIEGEVAKFMEAACANGRSVSSLVIEEMTNHPSRGLPAETTFFEISKGVGGELYTFLRGGELWFPERASMAAKNLASELKRLLEAGQDPLALSEKAYDQLVALLDSGQYWMPENGLKTASRFLENLRALSPSTPPK